jgi:hypothetical protein
MSVAFMPPCIYFIPVYYLRSVVHIESVAFEFDLSLSLNHNKNLKITFESVTSKISLN